MWRTPGGRRNPTGGKPARGLLRSMVMSGMDPSVARQRLLQQHDALRRQLRAACEVAARVRAGTAGAAELTGFVRALKAGFVEHNQLEETWLGPLLRDTDSYGEVRIARMLGEHVEEHFAFVSFLDRPADQVTAGLDDFAEEIEAHMDAEERTFLHPAVLRDDLVVADTTGG